MGDSGGAGAGKWVDSLEPARFKTGWRRVWAGVIDDLVLWPLNWIEWGLIQLRVDGVVAVAWVLFQAAIVVAYTLVGHALFGATVGKAAMRVRVVGLDGQVPGWRRAALRDILVLVLVPYAILRTLPDAWKGLEHIAQRGQASGMDFAIVVIAQLWLFVEIVTMIFNKRRRALHDFIAGTVVVRTDERQALDGNG